MSSGAIDDLAAPILPSPGTSKNRNRAATVPAVVAVVLIALTWQLVAWLSGDWVPGIQEVAKASGSIMTTQATYSELLITLRRLAIAFVAATILGMFIGGAMGFSRTFEALARPLVVIGLAIPDPMYFIFALLLLGTDEHVGMIALVLAVIPFVVHGADTGVRNRDRGLDEMSKVYRLSRRSYFIDVLGRQIAPIAMASMRTSLAFSWKIVVLMEALTQPHGIGAQIYYAFRLLRPADMIAYALLFVVIMRLIELALLKPLDRRLAGWAS